MSRLVFQLSGSVGLDNLTHVQISLSEPPVFGVPAHPFHCTGDEKALTALRDTRTPVDDATRNAGLFLYEEVMRHPGVATHLPAALSTQRPQRYPVFVELATGAEIEALPWESLCSPDGDFLGLDERWAVGRIVSSPIVGEPYWYFAPPLRIAAVLSCLGIPAADEWQAFQDALAAVPGAAVELLVVVSEHALYEQLSGEGGPAHLEMMPEDLADLQRLVAGFRPHLLHFFCHGSVRGGPHLELAFGTDWTTERPERSLTVEAREFRDFVEGACDPPWMTVLNCCQSAACGDGPENLQSMALQLVYEGGLPAVIGMRESVPQDDAVLFTRAFYERLLRELEGRADAPPDTDEPIDWAMLLVAVRTRLAHKHKGMTLSQAASSTKEWTIPAVYLRPTPTSVRPAPPAPPVPPAPPTPAPEPQPADGPPPGTLSGTGTLSVTGGSSVGGSGVAERPGDAPRSRRAARKEIEVLKGLLAQLPASMPAALRQDAEARLGELTRLLERR
ncbi:CHAT domain-containing protein [Kitasatospora sp. NPDC088346]|uniref:CHAT domain-containing protein n=1 Tax=Kitasatospora sp. NPDC088346 TaxID=3364073 RepID=UPI00380394C2